MTKLFFFFFNIIVHNIQSVPIPVAARSKAFAYGPSLVQIVGSNPAGSMVVPCECCMCQVERCLCDGPIAHSEESCRMWCA